MLCYDCIVVSYIIYLDVDEHESMLEKIELLEDIHTAEKQIQEGKGVEHEKAKAQVLKGISK